MESVKCIRIGYLMEISFGFPISTLFLHDNDKVSGFLSGDWLFSKLAFHVTIKDN